MRTHLQHRPAHTWKRSIASQLWLRRCALCTVLIAIALGAGWAARLLGLGDPVDVYVAGWAVFAFELVRARIAEVLRR